MRKTVVFIALIFLASAFKLQQKLEDPKDCIIQKCPNQWAACEKDAKCDPALLECQKKCGTSSSCWSLCLSTKGSQAAIDVARCAQKQGCDKAKIQTSLIELKNPQDCIQKFCKKEEQACENDRRCIQVLNFCDDRCNTTLNCWKDCVDRSKDANASNYFNCIIKNSCLNSTSRHAVALADPQQCVEQKCPNEWANCQKDSKCIPALDSCQKKCGTSSSCWTFCLPTKGSQAAIDVAKCAQKNGCLGAQFQLNALALYTPQQCIEQHCQAQSQDCRKDRACFAALQDCEKECRDNQTCWSTCLAKKGNAPASAFWKCIIDNDCMNKVEDKNAVALADPQQCVEQKCPNEWANCQKDSKCIPALDSCQKKCGTSSSCWTFCLPTKGSQAAIDVAKCAQKNGCLGAQKHPFVSCMQKSCISAMSECLYDKECSSNLHKCAKANKFDYDFECLLSQSKRSVKLASWYQCAGENFCL